MAYDETLAEEVRNALSGLPVEEKKAFGGLAFMIRGKMGVSVNNRPDHVMMVRIDPNKQQEALKKKGAKIAVMREKEMRGWIFLTKEAITTEEEFMYWINAALKYNQQLTVYSDQVHPTKKKFPLRFEQK